MQLPNAKSTRRHDAAPPRDAPRNTTIQVGTKWRSLRLLLLLLLTWWCLSFGTGSGNRYWPFRLLSAVGEKQLNTQMYVCPCFCVCFVCLCGSCATSGVSICISRAISMENAPQRKPIGKKWEGENNREWGYLGGIMC